MEVRINKEIREYSENMFFGLTLRQFFFSVLGCAASVGIYFLCRGTLGLEITTWLCVLGVVPFAAIGFIRYNGMSAEQIAAAYIKSKIVFPYRYLSLPVSIYYEVLYEPIAIKQGTLTKKEYRKIEKRNRREAKEAKRGGKRK